MPTAKRVYLFKNFGEPMYRLWRGNDAPAIADDVNVDDLETQGLQVVQEQIWLNPAAAGRPSLAAGAEYVAESLDSEFVRTRAHAVAGDLERGDVPRISVLRFFARDHQQLAEAQQQNIHVVILRDMFKQGILQVNTEWLNEELIETMKAGNYSQLPEWFTEGLRLQNFSALDGDATWKRLLRELHQLRCLEGVLYREVAAEALSSGKKRLSEKRRAAMQPVRQLLTPPHMIDELLRLMHDEAHAAHQGQKRTGAKCQQYFWWPNLGEYIKKYVATCPKCTEFKARDNTPRAPLYLHAAPLYPFERIGIDLIGR